MLKAAFVLSVEDQQTQFHSIDIYTFKLLCHECKRFDIMMKKHIKELQSYWNQGFLYFTPILQWRLKSVIF